MEAPIRQVPDFVKHLQKDISLLEFHQAIRLIQRFLKTSKGELSLKVDPSLAFPVSDLKKINTIIKTDSVTLELWISFMGLIGSSAVLPHVYSELLLERLQAKDSTFFDFLNLFHNRLISLFYELSTLSSYYLAYELEESHPLMDVLSAVSGQNLKKLSKPLRDTVYYHAGLLGMQTRICEGLCAWLQNYFDLPVEIKSYSWQWINLLDQDRSRLGSHFSMNYLGVNTLLGKGIWLVQNKVTILVGPISYQEFTDFLPDSEMFEIFNQIVHLYLGLEYEYEIKVLLKREGLPILHLGKQGPGLGLGACLQNKKSNEGEDEILSVFLTNTDF